MEDSKGGDNMAHNNNNNYGMNWQGYPQQPTQQQQPYYANPVESNPSTEDFFPTIDLTQIYDPAIDAQDETSISKRIMFIDELIKTYSVDNNLTGQTDFNNIPPPPPTPKANHPPQYKMKRTRTTRQQTTASTSTAAPEMNMNVASTVYNPYAHNINNINIQAQNFSIPIHQQAANYPYYANDVNNHKLMKRHRSGVRISELPHQNWNSVGYQQHAIPAIEAGNRMLDLIPEAVTSAQSQLNLINQSNISALRQIGQETLIEVVKQSEEMFHMFKGGNNTEEANFKLGRYLHTIKDLLKRIEVVTKACCDNSKILDLGKVDSDLLNRLLNYKKGPNMNLQTNIKQEDVGSATEARAKCIEEALMKNSELRQAVDRLRMIIWQYNPVKIEPESDY